MIRIVGVQRSEIVEKEFVLLQNQGSMRSCLRGHVILSEQAIESGESADRIHIFGEDELIPPGMYVLLFTGPGVAKWTKTKDGALVYHAYMNKCVPVWENAQAPIHVLNTQHSYMERRDAMLLLH